MAKDDLLKSFVNPLHLVLIRNENLTNISLFCLLLLDTITSALLYYSLLILGQRGQSVCKIENNLPYRQSSETALGLSGKLAALQNDAIFLRKLR